MTKQFFFIIIMLICKMCTAQNIFHKAFYGSNLFQSKTAPTADSGYILTARKLTIPQDDDIFLIRMDANGDTLWTKTYLNPGNDQAGEDVMQTIDGGFFLVACNYVMKTDSLGNPMWAKVITSNTTAISRACIESPNGDIIIVSGTFDFSAPSTSKIILTKLDLSGNLIFMKSFGNFQRANPYCVRITNDGGYIIAGETAYGAPSNDALLIKTDSLGNFIWARRYGGNGMDIFRSVVQTANGDYLALGNTSLNIGDFLVKVNSAGALIWSRTYDAGGNAGANACRFGAITNTYDQNFVFVDDNANLVKIDSAGNILWAKTYLTGLNKRFNSIRETSDGGLISSGYYSGGGYLYLVKSDSTGPNPCFSSNIAFTQIPVQSQDLSIVCTVSTGSISDITIPTECFGGSTTFLCVGVGVSENKTDNMVVVSPNPFSNRIEIRNDNDKFSEFILYDITSRKILHQNFVNSIVLNTEHLTKGIYIYEIRCGISCFTQGKLVKD